MDVPDFSLEVLYPVKNERLLKAIRKITTCTRCGTVGPVQAAHLSGMYAHLFGKGTSRKSADCCVAALCLNCHLMFDQYLRGNNEQVSNEFFVSILRTYFILWESRSINIKAG